MYSNYTVKNPATTELFERPVQITRFFNSGSSVRLGHAGSSPVSRTKALKTQRFQGFFLSFQGYFPSILRAKFCAGFLEENLVGRIGMKQVEGLGNVTVETAIEEFLKNCRFRSLTSTKQRTGICLVNAIRFSSTTLIDKKIIQ